jgi:hypothetical protein
LINPSDPEAGECRISSEMWQEKNGVLLLNASAFFEAIVLLLLMRYTGQRHGGKDCGQGT